MCSGSFTCCYAEIEVADQVLNLTQSQYTDTGPTSFDPISPGAWQGSHRSANVEVSGMIRPGKIPSQMVFELRIFRSRGGRLNHLANEAVSWAVKTEEHSIWRTVVYVPIRPVTLPILSVTVRIRPAMVPTLSVTVHLARSGFQNCVVYVIASCPQRWCILLYCNQNCSQCIVSYTVQPLGPPSVNYLRHSVDLPFSSV